MKAFKLNEEFTVICEFEKTRNGFRHLAHLLKNGEEWEKCKVCYLNRTWESFEFETVLLDCINKSKILTNEEKTEFKSKIINRQL